MSTETMRIWVGPSCAMTSLSKKNCVGNGADSFKGQIEVDTEATIGGSGEVDDDLDAENSACDDQEFTEGRADHLRGNSLGVILWSLGLVLVNDFCDGCAER